MIGSSDQTPAIMLHPEMTNIRRNHLPPRAFTLIEVLVSLFIMMVLASIALPMTRNIIRDQRNARASQILLSFIESTRNQAIAENREMGVIFNRLGTDDFGRSASVEVRQLRGLPTYTGETSNARATLVHIVDEDYPDVAPTVPAGMVNAARFDVLESPLVLLSYQILADSGRDNSTAPIQSGQHIELPGGQLATIVKFARAAPGGPLSDVIVGLDIYQPVDIATGSGRNNPHGLKVTNPPQRVPYAIHRTPVVSNARSVSLPRGAAIDFNYSGFGVRGNEFSAANSDVPISVFFDSQGRVSRVGYRGAIGYVPPVSPLFFCVGDFDGIQPDDLLNPSGRNRANIFRPNSTWIVLNPASGRVTASPFNAVTPPDAAFSAEQLEAYVPVAIEQARLLAKLGDTLE